MTWLTPILAGVAAAVAIPSLLILYFLKLRRREVEISTTLLWKKAIEDLRANAPFQRLRNNILLILQMLALLAALFAIAQPELRANLDPGQRFVLMIDRSASMAARDGDESDTRLDQAKREARAFVENLREPGLLRSLGALGGRPASDEAMIVAFDSGAQVVQPFTANKRMLLAAIDGIAQADTPTTLDEALRLAGAYTVPAAREDGAAAAPSASIHLWTDGRVADAEQLRPSVDAPMTFHAVGAVAASNVAITSVGAERQFDEPTRLSVFTAIQATVTQDLAVDVELTVDGVVAGVKRVTLAAMGPEGPPTEGGVVFELEQPEGALLRVRVAVPENAAGEDLLAVDNAAYLAVPPARRATVLAVTSGSLYLQYALEGLNLARLDVMTPGQFAREASSAGASLSVYDAIILDGEASVAGLESLPTGQYLALGAPLPIEGVAFAGDPEPTIVLDYERDHPVLKNAGLERMTIAKARRLELDAAARSLARGQDGPLIAEAIDGATTAILTSFDPGQSDWPFDVGFVIFLAEAVESLSGAGGGALPMLTPGETGQAVLPGEARAVTLVEPGGRETPLVPSPDGATLFGPLQNVGLYAIRWDGPRGASDMLVNDRSQRPVAVNLLSPHESDIRTEESLDLATRSVAAQPGSGAREQRRALWPWLILGCLAVLMLEWWVYNRKVML
ncbi:MAG: VWA domain-containing protein [Phycisphaerales bacterium]